MRMFIDDVKEQLSKMSEEEKDKWTLDRAILQEVYQQQNFLLTLYGTDWIKAFVALADKWDIQTFSKRLIEIFTDPICAKLNPSMLIGENIPDDLFYQMKEILENYYVMKKGNDQNPIGIV